MRQENYKKLLTGEENQLFYSYMIDKRGFIFILPMVVLR